MKSNDWNKGDNMPAMKVILVIVDNGDTEPEIWAFESYAKATEFAQNRGNASWAGITVQEVGVLSDADADEVIITEKEQI